MIFKDSTLVKKKSKFYTRIFTLYIQKENFNNIPNNQIQINNVNNNFNDHRRNNANFYDKFDNFIERKNSISSINKQSLSQNQGYIFFKKGLKNLGTTNYINAALQLLLHVNELMIYFVEEYSKDEQVLVEINKNNVISRGDISKAFYNLVININENSGYANNMNCININKKVGFNFCENLGDDSDKNSFDKDFAPVDFQRNLEKYLKNLKQMIPKI